jgi:hypothetical protein
MTLPWIELQEGLRKDGPPVGTLYSQPRDSGWHAVFAARVYPKPFSEIQTWQWGFNAGALLEEAMERQKLFLAAQHPAEDFANAEYADRRSLALRCIWDPEIGKLSFFLLGKVAAETRATAHKSAEGLWRALSATFPYDYNLDPVTTSANFYNASGLAILIPHRPTMESVEIRRAEGIFSSEQGNIYLPGKWQNTIRADEQVWRALCSANQPLIYSVTLRPTVLFDFERQALQNILAGVLHIEAETPENIAIFGTQWVKEVLESRLNNLLHPYYLQVHLISPASISDYLLQAIGGSFTFSKESRIPGYQVIRCKQKDQVLRVLENLLWLEPDIVEDEMTIAEFKRIRYLFSIEEAQAAFRWPFPPANGIPGVQIAGGS